jgi:hypothetical protein
VPTAQEAKVLSALTELADKADEAGLREVADRVGHVMAGVSSGCFPMLELGMLAPISRTLSGNRNLLRISRIAEAHLWKMAAAPVDPDLFWITDSLRSAVELYKRMLEQFQSTKKINASTFNSYFKPLVAKWKDMASQRGAGVSEPKLDPSSAQAFLTSAERALRQIYSSIQAWGRLGEISKQKEEERKDPSVFRPFFYQNPGLANQILTVIDKWMSKLPTAARKSLDALVTQIRSLAPAGKTAARFDFDQVVEMRFADMDRLFENAFGSWLRDPEVKAFVSLVKADLKRMWEPEPWKDEKEAPAGTPEGAPAAPAGGTAPSAPPTSPAEPPAAKPPLPPVAEVAGPPAGRTRGIPTTPFRIPARPQAPAAPVAAPAPAEAVPVPAQEPGMDVATRDKLIKEHAGESVEKIREALGDEGKKLSDQDIGMTLLRILNSPEDLEKSAEKMSSTYAVNRVQGNPGATIMMAIEKLASAGFDSNKMLMALGKLVPDLYVPMSVIKMVYNKIRKKTIQLTEQQPQSLTAMVILGPRLAKGMADKILERKEGKGPRHS